MLHKTEYTLRQHGEDITVKIAYQHQEAAEDGRGESLQVIAAGPVLDFSEEAQEEIELHCWTDLVTKQSKEQIAENLLGSPLTNPDQEIPCRKH